MVHPLLAGLQDPNRAFLMLLGGFVLIYRECLAPGRILPGMVGGVFVLTAGFALFQYPWRAEGLGLLLLGALLLVVQAFRNWYWLPGLAGTACILYGAIRLLIIPSIRPAYAAAAVPFSALTIFLARTAVRARRNKLST